MRRVLATAVVAALTTTVGATHAAHHGGREFRQVKIPTRPCPDDSGEYKRPCFWDAGARGNGHGRSFWTTRDGRIVYLDPSFRR